MYYSKNIVTLEKRIVILKVYHPCCVCIIWNGDDTIHQYTSLYSSSLL